MELVRTFKEFTYTESPVQKIRNQFRQTAVTLLSVFKQIDKSSNWIRFPYYHHVFDDEQIDFERQLRYLKKFGEFVSIDDAVELIKGEAPLNGRFFCLSFDDGYRCCYTNLMPITASLNIPVIIYLPVDYINLSENNPDDIQMIRDNLPGNPKLLSFLSWDQCREMLKYNVSFGSHTKSHAQLMNLTSVQIHEELLSSKEIIEKQLGLECIHFACPWGRSGINFDPVITNPITAATGYQTFATTHRGKMVEGSDLYFIKRDHLLASWSNYQLNYFLGE